MVTSGFNAAFGTRLRALRQERNLSQQVLADRAGMSQHKVSDIEVGRVVPTLTPEELMGLCETLEVGVNDLLGLESPPAERVARVATAADSLEAVDLALVATLAEHLAGLRRAARPSEFAPAAASLTPAERAAIEAERAFQARANRLRAAAEPGATYRTGDADADQGKARRKRRT